MKFSSWIYRITHNQVISHWRKNSRNVKIGNNDNNFDVFEIISIEEDIEKDVLKKCSAREIKSILEEMNEKYREVIVLKFFEEKSYEEISDILKKPIGTVGTLISRAKKQFKEISKRKGFKF